MRRALELAARGTKLVKDNPRVGAILVCKNKIIGEGYHIIHGQAHAEVNCINSVKVKDQSLITDSIIYVTLEPCFHEGKTPPCVDLILKYGIKTVIIGTKDPNPKVGGKSIEKLRSLGVEVVEGILEIECQEMIRPFLKMMIQKTPWVLLKFAKSKYNFIAPNKGQVWLSSKQSRLYTHRLRGNVDAIMIGTNTAKIDDPSLTTRLVNGDHPIRVVLDRNGSLPESLKVFKDQKPTIYVTSIGRKLPKNVEVMIHDFEDENSLINLFDTLYKIGIYRLLIEGGARLLRSIQKEGIWDEAIIINTPHSLNEGIKAPNFMGRLIQNIYIENDVIQVIRK